MKPNRDLVRAWQQAAVSCGLKFMSHGMPLTAWIGLLMVRIQTSGHQEWSTRVEVVIPGPPDFVVVRIRPEPRDPERREVEIGDESFDRAFSIEGPVPLVLALLDAETRRLLLHLSTVSRLEIHLGTLRADMLDEKVSNLLPLLIDVGQRLARAMDIPRSLAENITKEDPVLEVRRQSLHFLIREHPEAPKTLEALRAACSDPSPEIRLRAATELGAEGRAALVELASGPVEDALSAQAVSIVGRELSLDLAGDLLDQAVHKSHFQTARAWLEVLGQRGDTAAVDMLAKVLASERGELADIAVEALGRTGSPAAEAPLIRALGQERAEIRAAAAKALGRVGSATAVPSLKEAARRFWLDLDLRRATRQAIAEIRSRLQDASPGQLSLVGTEAGQLSLAGAEAGQLSLASDPVGRVSLSSEEEEERRLEPGRPI